MFFIEVVRVVWSTTYKATVPLANVFHKSVEAEEEDIIAWTYNRFIFGHSK